MLVRTIALLLCLAFPVLGTAQTPELKLPSFDHLRAKAIDTTDITLGVWPLKFAALFMDDDDPEDAQVKQVLRGLKGIHVVSYTFDKDFEYPEDQIEAVREQLQQAGWSQLVHVRNRRERSAVDVCVVLDEDGKRARGLAVVASEPREFTIVNLIGSIDMDTLARLEGHFGMPHVPGVGEDPQRDEGEERPVQ